MLRLTLCGLAFFLFVLEILGAEFAGGNIVLLRVTTTGTLSTTAAAVVLDEITTGGTAVQSVAVPSTGSSACTLPGVSTGAISGKLTTSTGGNLVSFACYASPSGTTIVASRTGNRGVQLVNAAGTLGTRYSLVQFNNPAREVYAALVNTAGTDFYLSGEAGPNVRALSYGASGVVLTDNPDASKVRVFSARLCRFCHCYDHSSRCACLRMFLPDPHLCGIALCRRPFN
jgi:hypothetical protein